MLEMEPFLPKLHPAHIMQDLEEPQQIQAFQVPAKLVLSSKGKVFRKQPIIQASESPAPSKSSSMDAVQVDDSPSKTPDEGNKCDMRGPIWMKKKQDSLWEKGEIK